MEQVSSHVEDFLRTAYDASPAPKDGVVPSLFSPPLRYRHNSSPFILGKNWEEIGKKKYNHHASTIFIKKQKGGSEK
jgi:hypothetical protein